VRSSDAIPAIFLAVGLASGAAMLWSMVEDVAYGVSTCGELLTSDKNAQPGIVNPYAESVAGSDDEARH
jgi:hypothetical protein